MRFVFIGSVSVRVLSILIIIDGSVEFSAVFVLVFNCDGASVAACGMGKI